jgi:hypothetical protein
MSDVRDKGVSLSEQVQNAITYYETGNRYNAFTILKKEIAPQVASIEKSVTLYAMLFLWAAITAAILAAIVGVFWLRIFTLNRELRKVKEEAEEQVKLAVLEVKLAMQEKPQTPQ